jgi:hypothetical protein
MRPSVTIAAQNLEIRQALMTDAVVGQVMNVRPWRAAQRTPPPVALKSAMALYLPGKAVEVFVIPFVPFGVISASAALLRRGSGMEWGQTDHSKSPKEEMCAL